MQYEKGAPDTEEEHPGVPDKIRRGLNQRIRGGHRITIERQNPNLKFQTINAVRFTGREGGMPDTPVGEIADAVTCVLHADWIDKGEEGESVRYRITVHRKSSKEQRKGFTHDYNPDSDERMTADEFENEGIRDLFDRMQYQLDRAEEERRDDRQTIVRLAELNAAPLQAVNTVMGYATTFLVTGYQAHADATNAERSREIEREAQTAKTARATMFWDRFGGHAQMVGFGVMKWGADKLGIDVPDPPKPGKAAATADGGASEEAVDEEDDDKPPEHPLAFLADTFGNSIDNQQRQKMKDTFGEHLELFDTMFRSTTDAEAIDRYAALAKVVNSGQLMAIAGFLRPAQMQLFVSFKNDVEAAIKAKAPVKPARKSRAKK